MFSKALLVAFLSLSFSAHLAGAAPVAEPCDVSSSASSPGSTPVLISTGGSTGAKTGASTGKGSSGSKAGSGATSSTSGSGNNHVDVGTGSSSSSAAATSSSASASSGGGDLQTSLTLDSSLINTGFSQNGNNPPVAGQAASLTSTNNFINFCATTNLPQTNGTQVKGGSCNSAPMGMIAATTAMPSAKFVNPANLATIKANENFTITMAISNLDTGNFVNADENYFAAPQQLNSQGLIQGHSHVVVEALSDISQTTPTNPQNFAFFKGLNDAAVNGQLTAVVSGGLPAGTYKLSSINSAANHQPALVAVAQHGSLDDAVYFYVTDDGTAPAGSASASSAVSSAASTATGTTNQKGGSGAAAVSSATASSAAGKATATGAAGKAGSGADAVASGSASAATDAKGASATGAEGATVTGAEGATVTGAEGATVTAADAKGASATSADVKGTGAAKGASASSAVSGAASSGSPAASSNKKNGRSFWKSRQ